ncbi:alpha/beta hydrolase [Thioflexithrix psekupsensis]|uniref:Alpha/beta hydrolase n=2 Tax=Thioflexithrix psekupsensis TaxID=1570016 RepID=A0A251XC77_9GAMM|nr:alpha/beta hydrolase [Thioflexithrix psekupsensis]
MDWLDPLGIGAAYWEVQQGWERHPHELLRWIGRLNQDQWRVQWQSWERFMGLPAEDPIPPVQYDERFQEADWTENPYLDTIKEFYLLYTRWIEDLIYATPDIEDKARDKTGFWVRQILNAIAPTNFFWTNPIAIKKYVESNGHSLLSGLKNLQTDLSYKTIRMVDETPFKVGENIATTRGQVVYRNELFELLQYAPKTETVHHIPLLFVPPWINKFYVLDLGKRSLVQYLLEQGYTVFMISWRNPPPEMGNTHFEDYMLKGVLQAVEVAKNITQAPHVHPIGYCIGGIVLTALMAWLNHTTEDKANLPIQSWTVFATLVDFSQPGEIGIFIDKPTIGFIEKLMDSQGGYLDGNQLADTFRLLRSNSLIWHYYVHSYLYGEDLPQFDVLFWNMDTTRLPAAMHSFYLREFYLNNRFMKPDDLVLGGRSIDVRRITQPLYAVSAEQDHIAPWLETFKLCGTVSSPVRHVLATSGHILGIISPPVQPPKRRYWVGDATGQCDGQAWLATQAKIPGSWWEDWSEWLRQPCGERQAPPSMGNAEYPPLCAAPGTYVLEK